MSHKKKISRPNQAKKQRNSSTKDAILSVAERLFAARGFDSVSCKKICRQANVSPAAINYYYGGKEALYKEVLEKAKRQNVWSIFFDHIHAADLTAERKLEMFFQRMLEAAKSPEFAVVLREIVSTPSAFHKNSSLKSELIRARYRLSEIVHSMCGLPKESPEMERGITFMLLPLLVLALEPRVMHLLDITFPIEIDDFAKDMLVYSLGGVAALKNSQIENNIRGGI